MHRLMLSSLPSFDRHLLCAMERLVPQPDRAEWSHGWQAELWHLHHSKPRHGVRAAIIMLDLAIGLMRDALWLRTESWRCLLHGTAVLCLGSLAFFSLLCILFAFGFSGSWQGLFVCVKEPGLRCLVSAPLVLFVGIATASRRHMEPNVASQFVFRLKRICFFVGKALQVFLMAFLLSMAACWPLHLLLPHTADLYQMFGFVLLSLLGTRWALRDQEQRCKQCLRSLSAPMRVGRPSHNLLEWNGTELSCKQGHGMLSVPEIETSWCQSSHWIHLHTPWDEPMSI